MSLALTPLQNQQPGGVDVRLATADDDARLLAFLDQYWRKGHVFVRQPGLYRWQHSRPDDAAARNFVLAMDRASQELFAIQGFIPLRRFDPDLPQNDAFLAIWKTRDDAGPPGLGLKLYQRLLDTLRPDMVSVIGLSQMVIPLYRALRFHLGLFDHHVFFRRGCEHGSVASGVPELAPVPRLTDGVTLHSSMSAETVPDLVSSAIDRLAQAQRPQKSWTTLVERALRHPVHDYRLSWFSRDDTPLSAFVWRPVSVAGTTVLRIVDVVGETSIWSHGAGHFQGLLEAHRAEYLDVYHHGLSSADLLAAGFTDRRATPGLIVPNYFQPFVPQNVELDFGYRFYGPATGPVRLFRGDADQDRPNEPAPFRQLDRPQAA